MSESPTATSSLLDQAKDLSFCPVLLTHPQTLHRQPLIHLTLVLKVLDLHKTRIVFLTARSHALDLLMLLHLVLNFSSRFGKIFYACGLLPSNTVVKQSGRTLQDRYIGALRRKYKRLCEALLVASYSLMKLEDLEAAEEKMTTLKKLSKRCSS